MPFDPMEKMMHWQDNTEKLERLLGKAPEEKESSIED